MGDNLLSVTSPKYKCRSTIMINGECDKDDGEWAGLSGEIVSAQCIVTIDSDNNAGVSNWQYTVCINIVHETIPRYKKHEYTSVYYANTKLGTCIESVYVTFKEDELV